MNWFILVLVVAVIGCRSNKTEIVDPELTIDENNIDTISMQNPIIIDHLYSDLNHIPLSWIDSAKSKLNIFYGRTSHGKQLTEGGMTAIKNFNTYYKSTYNYTNVPGVENALHIDEMPGVDLGFVNEWPVITREYLANHPKCNVVMWSWCNISDANIDDYIMKMEELISEFSEGGSANRAVPVNFVYMTGHSNIKTNKKTFYANKKIRDYCLQKGRILYDFYDLECYDPSGKYFGDSNMDGTYSGHHLLGDDCSYNLPQGGRGNWGIEWMIANPNHELSQMAADTICTYCGHSMGLRGSDNSRLQCVLKGNASWALWTRLAGWQGL